MLRLSLVFIFIANLFGCSNELKKTIYRYNSDEYKRKIEEFKFTVQEASEIASKFYFESNPRAEKFEFDFDFILGDYYVFPSPRRSFFPKTEKYYLSGFWVNGKTGEVIQKNTDEYIKVKFKIPFSSSDYYSNILTNNKIKDSL